MTVVDRVRSGVRTAFGRAAGKAGRPLTRVSIASFLLKAVSMVLLFGYGLLLARLLGSVEYGVYEYAFAWLTLFLVPAVFGLDKILLRTLAASRARGAWGEARALLRWSTVWVAALSIGLGATAGYLAWSVAGGSATPTVVALWIVCATLPVSALTVLWEGALRGLHRVIEGQLPILIGRPVLAIALLVIFVRVLPWPAEATVALAAFFLASAAAMVFAGVRLWLRLPAGLKRAEPVARPLSWLAAALPLAVMAALYIANGRLGVILLGSMTGPEDAGVFALITRGTDLIMFPLVAVQTALSPTFAGLQAAGDRLRLQRVVTRGTVLMFVLAFPIAFGLFLFGHQFLLLFGPSFVVGLPALRILVLAQFLSISMGPVGILLVMTGRERLAMIGFASGAIVNVGLAFLLIPRLGVEGAALAATASIVIWNLLLAVLTYRALGVDATIFGPALRWMTGRGRDGR